LDAGEKGFGQISDVPRGILESELAGDQTTYLGTLSVTDFLINPDHWRRRAEQTRAIAADAVKDQDRLLRVAKEYDRLAAHAEQQRNAQAQAVAASRQPK
jgi:hypothetical protein